MLEDICLEWDWFSISSVVLCVYVSVTQSYPTLCDPTDCSPPFSSVLGILQARILEGGAVPSPGDLPDPGVEPGSPALAGRFFTVSGSLTWNHIGKNPF